MAAVHRDGIIYPASPLPVERSSRRHQFAESSTAIKPTVVHSCCGVRNVFARTPFRLGMITVGWAA